MKNFDSIKSQKTISVYFERKDYLIIFHIFQTLCSNYALTEYLQHDFFQFFSVDRHANILFLPSVQRYFIKRTLRTLSQ